ncbi:MAG: FtsX-like permease family protein [Vicinamibacteria bacterium]
MKYLPFVFKHLRRNWVRTSSTVVAMAVCIFLLCTLRSVLAEVDGMLAASSATRLVTRHSVSLTFNLPIAYEGRIQSIPGVKRVAKTIWFGGSLPAKKEGQADAATDGDSTTDWSKFFNNMGVDAETYFAMYPELVTPPDQWQSFKETRQGCVIGSKLAKKFNWKVGDKFFLESFIPPYRRRSGPFEFVVSGIYDADLAKYPGTDVSSMYFHYDYIKEGVAPRDIGVGTFAVEIDNGDQAASVGKAIDALFENSSATTITETEQAFKASFIAMAGNLAFLLNGIGLAVAFTILLVTANTMSMAVRERRTEIAVLKTLGFGSGLVMALILAEAVLLGILGGAVGLGLSQGLLYFVSHAPGVTEILAGIGLTGLELKPGVAVLGFFIAVVLGLFAGLVPAVSAYRAKITDILRTV